MLKSLLGSWAARLFVLVLLSSSALAQQDGPRNFRIPDDVATRAVDIWSEGTRMSGTVFTLKANTDGKLPTILMAHVGVAVQGADTRCSRLRASGLLRCDIRLSRLGHERRVSF